MTVWIKNAYINAYTLPEDFKAMSCRSVLSQPTHLHSSKALAPTASAIGLSDQSRPPIGEFERVNICTHPLEISPKERRL